MKFSNATLACSMLVIVCVVAACSGRHATRDEAVADALQGMRAAARLHVDDLERQKLLLEAIDGMQADLRAFDEVLVQAPERVRALNARPDATRAEIATLVDELDVARKSARERVLQRHFDMIAITNADEWTAFSKYEREALMAAGRQ